MNKFLIFLIGIHVGFSTINGMEEPKKRKHEDRTKRNVSEKKVKREELGLEDISIEKNSWSGFGLTLAQKEYLTACKAGNLDDIKNLEAKHSQAQLIKAESPLGFDALLYACASDNQSVANYLLDSEYFSQKYSKYGKELNVIKSIVLGTFEDFREALLPYPEYKSLLFVWRFICVAVVAGKFDIVNFFTMLCPQLVTYKFKWRVFCSKRQPSNIILIACYFNRLQIAKFLLQFNNQPIVVTQDDLISDFIQQIAPSFESLDADLRNQFYISPEIYKEMIPVVADTHSIPLQSKGKQDNRLIDHEALLGAFKLFDPTLDLRKYDNNICLLQILLLQADLQKEPDTVRTLLKHNKDNNQNNNNNSLLKLLVSTCQISEKKVYVARTLKILIKEMLSPESENVVGKDLAKILLYRIAKKLKQVKKNTTKLAVWKELTDNDANFFYVLFDMNSDFVFNNENSLLIYYVEINHIDIVRFLLSKATEKELEGHFSFREFMDQANNSKNSSLMRAAELGNIEIVRLLLLNGADASLKNSFGETALILAQKKQNEDIVNLLKEHEIYPSDNECLGDMLNKSA